jgi:release factor glutamine methyltransferase
MNHKIIKFAVMTIEQVYDHFIHQLQKIYEKREANNIADWVFESTAGFKRAERIMNKNFKLDTSKVELLNSKLQVLLQYKPVQYVLQEAWFCKMKFFVNEHVLIPRPETEELVEWIAGEVKTKKNILKIIDIGTGSGCIAVALKKKLPHAEISAIDISNEALSVAAKNAMAQNTNIEFLEIDFLDDNQLHQLALFDIIVSNPPYIPEKEIAGIEKNVVEHEPHLALFVKDHDPFIFYKKIALFADLHLNKGGKIYVEVHEEFANEVNEIFVSGNFTTTIRKDMYGRNRMVCAHW